MRKIPMNRRKNTLTLLLGRGRICSLDRFLLLIVCRRVCCRCGRVRVAFMKLAFGTRRRIGVTMSRFVFVRSRVVRRSRLILSYGSRVVTPITSKVRVVRAHRTLPWMIWSRTWVPMVTRLVGRTLFVVFPRRSGRSILRMIGRSGLPWFRLARCG